MSPPQKTKLIYVLSAAYSGSTLMGLALGEHSGVINLGEVVNLESDYADTAKCTCQQRLQDCSFWSTVKSSVEADAKAKSQPTFNLSKSGEREYLDRRGGLKKIRLLLGASMLSTYSGPYLEGYRAKNESFFASVLKAFPDTDYLVDLSKSAERLEALLASEALDIWCIYLRRDPLKVYASTLKRPKRTRKFLGPKGIREALWLRARTKDMDKTFSKVPDDRKLEVDFNEFTARPQSVLNRIFEKLEIKSQMPAALNKPTEAFAIAPSQQHIYVGNRWLFDPALSSIDIKERSDTASLSWLHRLAFYLVWGRARWKNSASQT